MKPRSLGPCLLIAYLSLWQSAINAQTPGTPVFINELHYDNTGTDSGEAIEIAGPAGTDLTNWRLVLYNGSSGITYGTQTLGGRIPELCSGFGAIAESYPPNGIQNGSPDGIALVDASNNVVQFLSYEGAFTAADGPAAGLTSSDIGVAESSSSAPTGSLQLIGMGMVAEDFSWTGPVPSSFGDCNTDQTFTGSPPAPANPVINEFVFNHVGTDSDEFIEILGDPHSDYSAFTALVIEGDGAGAGKIDSLFPLAATGADGLWFTGFLSNALENGTATVVLVEAFTGLVGDDLDTDNDGRLDTHPWRRLVDCIGVTDAGSNDRSYCRTVLASGFDGIDRPVGGASRIPNGTDTDAIGDWVRNDFDGEGLPGFAGTPETGEALNTPDEINRTAVSLVINEVDADTPGTDTAEFTELYDGGAGNTDLSGLVLVLYNGNGDVSYRAFDLDGVSTDAEGYFVIGNPALTGVDLSFENNTLQNGADAVALYAADGADFPNGTPVTTDGLVDALVYDTNDADDAGLLVLLNVGEPQVDENANGNKDSASMQRCPNGRGEPRSTTGFEARPPTPDGENDCDVTPVVVPVYDVQGSGDRSPRVGQIVTIEGIVTGDFQDASAMHGDLNGFYVQEPVGDGDAGTSDGIFVFDGEAPAGDIAPGDRVRVTGRVTEFFGETQLDATGTGASTLR